jgi:hypothetical protein
MSINVFLWYTPAQIAMEISSRDVVGTIAFTIASNTIPIIRQVSHARAVEPPPKAAKVEKTLATKRVKRVSHKHVVDLLWVIKIDNIPINMELRRWILGYIHANKLTHQNVWELCCARLLARRHSCTTDRKVHAWMRRNGRMFAKLTYLEYMRIERLLHATMLQHQEDFLSLMFTNENEKLFTRHSWRCPTNGRFYIEPVEVACSKEEKPDLFAQETWDYLADEELCAELDVIEPICV